MTKMQRQGGREGGRGRERELSPGVHKKVMKRATRLIQMPTHHSTTLAGNYTISRSLKYSCSRACLAVILLLGSYRSIFCQQTEIGQLNALKLFDGTVMVINCYGWPSLPEKDKGAWLREDTHRLEARSSSVIFYIVCIRQLLGESFTSCALGSC